MSKKNSLRALQDASVFQMPKKRRSQTPPDTGRNQKLAAADFENQADWQYKKVTFSQWNDEFQRLKAKATKGKLNDPFERYLHDTYFPARARRSKQPKAHTTSTARKDEAPACANRGPRVKGGKAAAAAKEVIDIGSPNSHRIFNLL